MVPLDDSKTKLSEDTVYQKLVNDNLRPEIPSNFSEGIVEVLKKAWNTKPTDRASCEQLLIAIEKQILDMK